LRFAAWRVVVAPATPTHNSSTIASCLNPVAIFPSIIYGCTICPEALPRNWGYPQIFLFLSF
jgi:hypothetical protein